MVANYVDEFFAKATLGAQTTSLVNQIGAGESSCFCLSDVVHRVDQGHEASPIRGAPLTLALHLNVLQDLLVDQLFCLSFLACNQ